MSFKVIEKACDTCIYRADSPLDLAKSWKSSSPGPICGLS